MICGLMIFKPSCAVAQDRLNPSVYTAADPSEVKQKLRTILSRPEFAEHPQHESDFTRAIQDYSNRIESAWHDCSQWLEKWYDRIKEFFSFGGRAIGSSSFVFVCLFIAACIVTALYLFIKYVSRIGGARVLTEVRQSSSSNWLEDVLETADARTAEEWIYEANRMADQADYRAAIRARFLAVLLQLDASGLLEYTRTATNGDHLLYLTSNRTSDAVMAFRRLVNNFDFQWYGEHDADRSDYERCVSDCEVVIGSITHEGHSLAWKADVLVAG
jgi:hypothetical protein